MLILVCRLFFQVVSGTLEHFVLIPAVSSDVCRWHMNVWRRMKLWDSHFPWRARRRCGTAWGRRRRSSGCGTACTWPGCWWTTWPGDRRHSTASRAPGRSNSRSEQMEEEHLQQHKPGSKHIETHSHPGEERQKRLWETFTWFICSGLTLNERLWLYIVCFCSNKIILHHFYIHHRHSNNR